MDQKLNEIKSQLIPLIKKYGLWHQKFDLWRNEDWSYVLKTQVMDKYDYKSSSWTLEKCKEEIEDQLDLNYSLDVVVGNKADQQIIFDLVKRWITLIS